MWISPRMLYIQYVDMHLFLGFFASSNLDSSYFNMFFLSLTEGKIIIILQSDSRKEPASKMATVRMKVTWKVSVNIALWHCFWLNWTRTENKIQLQNPKKSQLQPGKLQVFFSSCQCVCIYYTCTKSWMFRSHDVRRSTAAPTPSKLIWIIQSGSSSTHLLSITVKRSSAVEVMRRKLPQSCLLKSLEWTDSAGHAGQTQGLFLHPLKKRLNSTFHIACQILSKLHVMMLFSFWI